MNIPLHKKQPTNKRRKTLENKYTPGEWHAHDGQIYPLETGKTLAIIPYFDNEDKEQQANAHLIAAAPKLLKACNRIASHEYGSDRRYRNSDEIKTLKRIAKQAIFEVENY